MKIKNINKREILKEIYSCFAIIFGAIIASFSVSSILLSNDAIDYGTAGIAIIISKIWGVKLPLCVFLTFFPFWILGLWKLGKKFSFKSLLGSSVYTLGISCFESISLELHTEHFISVCFGGALLGLGLSFILRFGGCIDGSEILANVIVDKLSEATGKQYSMTYFLIGFNTIVYAIVFFLIDANSALLSLLVFVVATVIIDHFTDHFDAIKQVTIITKDPQRVSEKIQKNLHKTCTIIQSKGAIAGNNHTVICYINYFDMQKMRDLLSTIDGTFTTVTTVDEIIK